VCPQQAGADGFTAGLRECGLDPHVEGVIVRFEAKPLTGALAGTAVDCGVEVEELRSWPAVPPHWLHLPSAVRFPRTNSQDSPTAGWLRHSRPPAGWGNDASPVSAYLAHVRGILGEAE
jgi:hypothetical protein